MQRARVSARRRTGDRALALLLVPAVALNAASVMVVEIVAGRLIAPYFGMSLYTWTTGIGVVLAGLSLGHWLAGWLSAWSRCCR